jgi:hypothetical protein
MTHNTDLDADALRQVVAREQWTTKRDKAIKRNGWKDARIAQGHINAAASELVRIAGLAAQRGKSL